VATKEVRRPSIVYFICGVLRTCDVYRNHRTLWLRRVSLLLSAIRVVPLLSITGVVLDGLGGLYLAYELLGGKHGALRLLSLC
jgi:hypothetical protein